MNRHLNNVFLGIFTIVSIVFLIPTYFQAHPTHGTFFNQLIPSWHLLWFVVLSFLVTYGVLAWRWYQAKQSTFTLMLRPVTLICSMLLGLLLLFNVFSFHPSSNVFRTYTENFNEVQLRLQQEGTLRLDFQNDPRAAARYLNEERQSDWTKNSILLFNGMFVLRILGVIGLLLLVSLSSYALGNALLHLFRWATFPALREDTHGNQLLIGIALGLGGWILGLMLLGAFGWLHPLVVTIALFLPPLLHWKATVRFCKWLWNPLPFGTSVFSLEPLLATTLWMFLVMTAYQLFRPIPIGWDDMTVYVNLPQLIANGHSLVSGFSAHGWSLIMSLGFILGNSATFTMFLSWFGGLLAALALLGFGRTFLGGRAGLLMATVFVSLPMTLFQMSQDMKVDMALMFFGLCSTYCFLLWWRREDHADGTRWSTRHGLLFLAALLLGFAFTIKYTAFLLLCVFFFLVTFRFFSVMSVLLLLGGIGLLQYFTQFFAILGIPVGEQGQGIMGATSLIVLLAGISATLIYRRKGLASATCAVLVFLSLFAAPMLPWLTKHALETGRLEPNALLSGQTLSPVLYEGPLGTQEVANTTTPVETAPSAVTVELGRYRGYEDGVFRYLSMPYDQTMNVHVQGQYVDIGYLFLILIPLALMALPKGRFGAWWNGIFLLLTLGIFFTTHSSVLSFSELLATLAQWLQAAPGTPLFLIQLLATLAVLLAGVISFWYMSPWSRKMKLLVIASLLYWLLWAVLASGVIWYGLLGFIPLLALIAYLEQTLRTDAPLLSYGYLLRYVFVGMILLWLGASVCSKLNTIDNTAFALYKGHYAGQELGQGNGGWGLNAVETIEMLLPAYQDAARAINADPTAKVYRAGTFLPYFISNNHKRVLTDSQLAVFHQLYVIQDQEDQAVFTERLRMSGIKFIAFDMNISTIDDTEEGTLIQDHQRFLEFVNNNPALTMIASKVTPASLSDLHSSPPRRGTTLVFYTPTGTILRAYTGPESLVAPEGTTSVGTGAGSGTLMVWKLN